MNLSVVEEMEPKYTDLDLIIIESGGDNITTTFSPTLAEYPGKRGLGIATCGNQ
jgi:urease accessory protein